MREAWPILLVDGDPTIRTLLPEAMKDAGYDTIVCGSLADADKVIAAPHGMVSAIVLDAALPDGDGCHFCRQLRGRGIVVPIVMLAEEPAKTDVVTALEWGANDYVVKPFGTAELIARLRAALRSFRTSEDASFDIGGFVFRPASRTLTKPGAKRAIRMTDKESDLLRQLYQAGGKPVTRDTLAVMWGYSERAVTHTIESHVYRLRQKIERDPRRPEIVLTSSGGYRLGTAPL